MLSVMGFPDKKKGITSYFINFLLGDLGEIIIRTCKL